MLDTFKSSIRDSWEAFEIEIPIQTTQEYIN